MFWVDGALCLKDERLVDKAKGPVEGDLEVTSEEGKGGWDVVYDLCGLGVDDLEEFCLKGGDKLSCNGLCNVVDGDEADRV